MTDYKHTQGPDLLETLEKYLPILESLEKTGCWDAHAYGTGIATANKYRAAIAKARGENQWTTLKKE